MENVCCIELNSSAPETVLILEGWATNTSLYKALAEHIAGLGFRVLLPDLPGFGDTPPPERSWDAKDYAEFVNRFLIGRGVTRVTLLGHSHGGRTIIKALGERLITAEVPKVILIDSAGIVYEKTPAQKRRAKRYQLAKKLLRPFPALLERYKKSKGSADYNAAIPVMRETLVKLVNEDLRGLLPGIAQPTLLIWGENDKDTPLDDGKLMESLLPDGGLVTVPGAGHYAHLDNPRFVYRVVDSFLGGDK
ncbi:MAG: alpha/beta hydrolase [Oscillospiraceae bacterium]|jgi:pimeloyl-ACP methyl ester carboxylesterase|nr:alpha/beta hydrolase [Oscillospiraceae bacterium]